MAAEAQSVFYLFFRYHLANARNARSLWHGDAPGMFQAGPAIGYRAMMMLLCPSATPPRREAPGRGGTASGGEGNLQ